MPNKFSGDIKKVATDIKINSMDAEVPN